MAKTPLKWYEWLIKDLLYLPSHHFSRLVHFTSLPILFVSKFGLINHIIAMASPAIEYIWKVARPKNEAIARALMYAAYATAIQTDPKTKIVLIR